MDGSVKHVPHPHYPNPAELEGLQATAGCYNHWLHLGEGEAITPTSLYLTGEVLLKVYQHHITERVTLGLTASNVQRLKRLQATYLRITDVAISRSVVITLALEALEQALTNTAFLQQPHASTFGFTDETREHGE